MKRLLLLAVLVIGGCDSPTVGDAPEARDGRPASSLPANPSRHGLDALRHHDGGKR